MRYAVCLLAVVALVLVAGCSMTRTARDYSGLSTPEGSPIAHVNTTNYAVHILFSQPVVGDARLQAVVRDCTAAAKKEGATSIDLVQSKVSTYWWIFPPISFVIHPVVANAAGDAY